MPAIPAARIIEQSAFGQQRGHRPSARREHAARHRFHAIQRGSCGYDASDRRRRSPEPKLVGSATRNSPRPKPSGPGPWCEWDTWPGARSSTGKPVRAPLALPREPGCRLCQDVALLTQAMVLTSKAPQFLPLSACRPINALAGVSVGLLHPSGNRLCGRLELTRPLLGRASRSHQIDHLSPELRRMRGSEARQRTPQKSTSRVSTKPGQLHLRPPAVVSGPPPLRKMGAYGAQQALVVLAFGLAIILEFDLGEIGELCEELSVAGARHARYFACRTRRQAVKERTLTEREKGSPGRLAVGPLSTSGNPHENDTASRRVSDLRFVEFGSLRGLGQRS